MGVKMIPPGVHLVTTQAVQQPSRHDGDQRQGTAAAPPSAAPALASFLSLPTRSVLVRGWDARAEALAPLLDADEEARFAAGARRGDFDRGLAPYDLGGGGGGGAPQARAAGGGGWARWRSLAGLITPDLAQRLMPPSVRLSDGRECAAPLSVTAEAAMAAEGGGAAPPSSAAERRLDAQLAEGRWQRREQEQQQPSESNALVVAPNPPTTTTTSTSSSGSALARLALAPAPEPTRARYTPIERLSKPTGLTPEQLTAANLDKSTAAEALLRAVVAREGAESPGQCQAPSLAALLSRGGPLLLGELQFAFAAFAAGGQSLEGFHQWRSIACLLLGCERLPFSGEEEEASAAATSFFAAFLRILAAQLRYALGVGGGGGGGGDQQQQQQQSTPSPLLVDDDLLRQSFLRQGVRRFLSALRAAEKRQQSSSPSSLGQLRSAAELVVSSLKEGLGGWEDEERVGGGGGNEGEGNDEDDDGDDDEDGPTVVDLDEGYAL
jgi:A1 cistron-splicing factor AAR2